MSRKVALIFGVTGQDGSYLAEHLLHQGYRVVGVKRRSSGINTQRIGHLLKDSQLSDRIELLHGDVTDSSSVHAIVTRVKPDEVYNLAAQSHVGVSFNEPEYTAMVDGLGVLRILEAIVTSRSQAKFYQASTSELFGGLEGGLLNETSAMNPRSPYAAAKLYAFFLAKQYREIYGLHVYNGILFNHESPRRGENFVSRKVTTKMRELFSGEIENISLGNLDAQRDWGHASDYAAAMHVMLQKAVPGDYVVASGRSFSVKQFVQLAFEYTGHIVNFYGEGVNCIGRVDDLVEPLVGDCPKLKKGSVVVTVDPKYFRPLEVPHLQGDSSKFRQITGWEPKYSFRDLVREMVEQDVRL